MFSFIVNHFPVVCIVITLILAVATVVHAGNTRRAEAAREEAEAEASRRREEALHEARRKAAAKKAQAAEARREAAEARTAAKQRKREAAEAARKAREAAQRESRREKLEDLRKMAEYKERIAAAGRAAEAGTNKSPSAAPDPAQQGPVESYNDFNVSCMLAKKYTENTAAVAGRDFTITEKLDGIRCIARVDHSSVALYTRNGKRIEGLTEIESALAALDVSAVLDGELLIAGRGKLPSKEEYKKTCSIVRSKGQKTGVVYHVFDMLSIDDYEGRRTSPPYSSRRAALDQLTGSDCVEIVPVLYSGSDAATIENHLTQQRALNHEGVMINLNDAPYSFTRTAGLLKYKVMNDCDLKIIAVNPGTGKNANTTGSLSVEYKGGVVRVGSGIPDALRESIWNNPAAYIGRVVKVQYFEETQDATGKKSLRFPSFVELREIGKPVSYA